MVRIRDTTIIGTRQAKYVERGTSGLLVETPDGAWEAMCDSSISTKADKTKEITAENKAIIKANLNFLKEDNRFSMDAPDDWGKNSEG